MNVRRDAQTVPFELELQRVIPVIEQLSKLTTMPIAIDTYKPEVMQRACDAGATLINDVRALREPGALAAAKACQVPVILLHMQNDPATMQDNPVYIDVLQQVNLFFQQRIQACEQVGISKEKIILDPGFGFGKTVQHNARLLTCLSQIKNQHNLPIAVGLSRKSMIGKVLGLPVNKRLYPSIGLAVYAALQGADIIRVHDVLATRQAVDMIKAVEAYQ